MAWRRFWAWGLVVVTAPVLANEQPVVAIGLSVSAKQVFLERSLNAGITKIEEFLLRAAPISRASGARPSECQPDQIVEMTTEQRWALCPGIPDYFFVDSHMLPSLLPRPIKINVDKFKIVHARFDPIRVTCEDTVCSAELPLRQLEINFAMALVNLNPSEKTDAGEVLLDLRPITLSVVPNHNGVVPGIKMATQMGRSEEGDARLLFDPSQSRLTLPEGSIHISLPSRYADLTLEELLNSNGKLEFSSRSFSTVLGMASLLRSDIRDLFHLIDLSQTINAHFDAEEKMGYFLSFFNSKVLSLMLEQLNQALVKSEVFSGTQIELPVVSLQDVVDADPLRQFISSYEGFLRRSAMRVSQGQVVDLDQFAFNDLSLQQGLAAFASSANLRHSAALDQLVDDLLDMKKHSDRPALRQMAATIDGHLTRVRAASAAIATNSGKNKHAITLRFKLEEHRRFLKLAVFKGKTSNTQVHHGDLGSSGDDFNMFLNFDLINEEILAKLHQQGRFDVCMLASDTTRTCSQMIESGVVRHLRTKHAPQILWNERSKSFNIEFAYLEGEKELGVLLAFAPSLDGKGGITSRVKVVFRGSDHDLAFVTVVTKILAFMAQIHPVMEYFIPQSVTAEHLQLTTFDSSFASSVPYANIARLDSSAAGISLGGRIIPGR